MAVEKRRIVLLGATGYTGQRVLRELLGRGEAPTLVGRNPAKMHAVAASLGADLPVIEADVTSAAELKRVFDGSDVVLSTVGPFTQLGVATITAAAQAGAHYLDSTGEGGFVRRAVEQLDSIATTRGATIAPAFGYDFVPGNLAGALALTQAGLLFAYEPQRRLTESGSPVLPLEAHPGISKTNLVADGGGLRVRLLRVMLQLFAQDAEGGARPTLHAATESLPGATNVGPSGFRELRGRAETVTGSAASRDAALAARLWQRSVELTGVGALAAVGA